eukprot:938691-Amorphochlora_amoeboformis.AAC.1
MSNRYSTPLSTSANLVSGWDKGKNILSSGGGRGEYHASRPLPPDNLHFRLFSDTWKSPDG